MEYETEISNLSSLALMLLIYIDEVEGGRHSKLPGMSS